MMETKVVCDWFVRDWLKEQHNASIDMPLVEEQVYKSLLSTRNVDKLLDVYRLCLTDIECVHPMLVEEMLRDIRMQLSDQSDTVEASIKIRQHAHGMEFYNTLVEIKQAYRKLVRRAYDESFDDLLVWLETQQKTSEQYRKSMIANAIKNHKKNFVEGL